MMYKIVNNLVDVNHDALKTVNFSSFARSSFVKLYKPTSMSLVRSSLLLYVSSMFGIIFQKRPDLVHLSLLLKIVLYLTIQLHFLSVFESYKMANSVHAL